MKDRRKVWIIEWLPDEPGMTWEPWVCDDGTYLGALTRREARELCARVDALCYPRVVKYEPAQS